MGVHYTVVWSNCGCCCVVNSDGAALFEVVATLLSHGLLALSVPSLNRIPSRHLARVFGTKPWAT
jgi:hypothetical protein